MYDDCDFHVSHVSHAEHVHAPASHGVRGHYAHGQDDEAREMSNDAPSDLNDPGAQHGRDLVRRVCECALHARDDVLRVLGHVNCRDREPRARAYVRGGLRVNVLRVRPRDDGVHAHVREPRARDGVRSNDVHGHGYARELCVRAHDHVRGGMRASVLRVRANDVRGHARVRELDALRDVPRHGDHELHDRGRDRGAQHGHHGHAADADDVRAHELFSHVFALP